MDWFRSYLRGRFQYVSVNGHSFDLLPISCGVPQGSVLGPLLFLIYVHDLPNNLKVFQFYLFADDTSIYFESDNLLTLQKVVNRELRKVRKWLEANRLSLSINKTNYAIFHSKVRKTNEFIRIKIGSKTIKHENYVKYLGILVDSMLNLETPYYTTIKKLSRSVGIFFRIKHYVTPETLKLLYYSLFHSFISYGISVWGLTHPTILDPLCKIQKKLSELLL